MACEKISIGCSPSLSVALSAVSLPLRLSVRNVSFSPKKPPKPAFKATTGMGRRSSRRPRRVQTPRPRRSSPDLTDSSGSSDEDSLEPDVDPDRRYRYSEPAVPIRRSYTPAPTHPGIPSVTTRTTLGQTRTPTPFRHLRPGSRQRSSQGSSGLTYVTDNPVIPFLPPGFIPSPGQDPAAHRQNPFPTPRVPFRQSPLHPAPVPPPPQMHHYRDRASSNGQSN